MSIDLDALPGMLDEYQDYTKDEKLQEVLRAAAARIRALSSAPRRTWRPMTECPLDRLVLVARHDDAILQTRFTWAIAKRRRIRVFAKPWWRFKFEWREIITYADSYTRRIEFVPTYWSWLVEDRDAPPLELRVAMRLY